MARVKDLESAWDAAQSVLKPLNPNGWAVLDGMIDAVLTEVRASSPDAVAEEDALSTLLSALSS